jgi:holo-[acyl-carrier protein] synthase
MRPGSGGTNGAGKPASGGVVGMGVDAVDVERFRAVLARRPSLIARLFTERERSYAERSADPVARLAMRFAAKEAVRKVFGASAGRVPWRDVEVVRSEQGVPALELGGIAAGLARERLIAGWHLSLTDTALVAVATVVATG